MRHWSVSFLDAAVPLDIRIKPFSKRRSLQSYVTIRAALWLVSVQKQRMNIFKMMPVPVTTRMQSNGEG